MDDEIPPNRRFVIGAEPANRRAADPALINDEWHSPEQVARARQLMQRHALGVPLAEQLAPDKHGPAAAPVPALSVGGIIGGTALLAWAVLAPGWASKAVIAGGSLVLYGLAWNGLRRSRRRAGTNQPPPGMAAGLDSRDLSLLDRLMDQVAPELPPELLTPLATAKATLVRVSLAARATGVSPAFTAEDQFYLQQTVRRYLPDSLQAYLRVPVERRGQPLDSSGTTASDSLASQLALIQQGLDEREARCTEGVGEALLHQQRFLQFKSRPRSR